MGDLRLILGIGAGAIVGLLVYGLTPAYQEILGIGAALATIGLIYGISTLVLREEDRDPTIRPTDRIPSRDRERDR